jgi:hypothetical protein
MAYFFSFAVWNNLTEGHWPMMGGFDALDFMQCRKLSGIRSKTTTALLSGYVSD